MFPDWSKQVNEQFKQQNRQCLMLLDNASSHFLSDTPMIKVGNFDCFNFAAILSSQLHINRPAIGPGCDCCTKGSVQEQACHLHGHIV